MSTLTFFFLLLSVSCVTDNQTSCEKTEVANRIESNMIEEPFGILLQIDKANQDQYTMAVSIELDSGDYVISPFSKDDIYSHFEYVLSPNDNLIVEYPLLEIPSSVEEMDPITESLVKFVRVNTTYTQNLTVVTQDDFEVSGLLEFVLEPSCIPYDVKFVLSYRSGEMSIKKVSTIISKEYKLNNRNQKK